MDFKDFISKQMKERYKSFIISAPSLSGKTKFVKKISSIVDLAYFDLLNQFCSDENLKSNVDVFGPEEFKKYILKLDQSKKVVLIDNIDFLINLWSEEEVGTFMNFVEKYQSNTCYVFVLQDDENILKNKIHNTLGQTRILNLNDIKEV